MTALAQPDIATLRAALAAPPTLAKAHPALAPLPPMSLARGRAHELTGPARRVLAAMAAGAAQAEGPVLWLRPGWRREGLCPQGLLHFADPGALVQAACPREADILWSMEEALRAGCVALVIAEVARTPDLRQLRRLHLAATEGGARGKLAPLGLLMAQDHAESRIAGVESRWSFAPWLDGGGYAWELARLHARDCPPARWQVQGLSRPGAGRMTYKITNSAAPSTDPGQG
jgi:protein ImuA